MPYRSIQRLRLALPAASLLLSLLVACTAQAPGPAGPTSAAASQPPGTADAPGGQDNSEAVFIIQIVVLMLVGRLLGEVLLRLRQPAVMGQLMAGLVLGPSLLGALFPDVQHALFPAAKDQKAISFEDLKEGEQVLVQTDKRDGKLIARAILLGATSSVNKPPEPGPNNVQRLRSALKLCSFMATNARLSSSW